MGVMRFIHIRDSYIERAAEVKALAQSKLQTADIPEINTDLIYEELMKEKKVESNEETWFDEELDKLAAEAQSESNKLKSEGDEAAKVFEQFAE